MDKTQIVTKVVRVQLSEDRALVVRKGSAVLPAGLSTLSIPNVSPIIVDKTVQCRVLSGQAKVVSCRVNRRRRIETHTKPYAIAAVERSIHEKTLLEAALEAEIAALESTLAKENDVYGLTLVDLATDVSFGATDAEAWHSYLDAIEVDADETLNQIATLSSAKENLAEEIRDLTVQLREMHTPEADVAADIHLDMTAPFDANDIEFELSYVAPGALWRPCYSAALSEERDLVRVQCDGMVWQNTGEDWPDAELTFSTERVSLGLAPPLLSSDVLSVSKSPETVQVETREEAIVQCGLSKTETVADLPGIDDGGSPLTLEGNQRRTVPSNGRPVRIPLFSFESDASFELRCCPELDEQVLWVTRQTNRSRCPLLPGPVDLIRRGGFIGRTALKFAAEGEPFELGFGPEDAIRVVREKEVLKHKARIISSWTETPYRVRIYLSNLGDTTRQLQVKERILVSEIDKIHVMVDTEKTTDHTSPDENGFLEWAVDLEGNSTHTIELAYTVKQHDDIVGLDL